MLGYNRLLLRGIKEFTATKDSHCSEKEQLVLSK